MQLIPPLVTEQMQLHGGARSKMRAPPVSQGEKMFTRNRETVFTVSKLCVTYVTGHVSVGLNIKREENDFQGANSWQTVYQFSASVSEHVADSQSIYDAMQHESRYFFNPFI